MRNVLFIAPTTYKLPLDKNMTKKFEYLSQICNLNVVAFANEKKELVKDKKQVDENIYKNEFKVIDARSRERFEGKVPEPRKGLRSGSIKNSFCLPFSELINEDHTFVAKEKILEKFKLTKCKPDENIVFTCGSGVTACILGLANSIISGKKPVIYDGSWAEYGLD